MKISELFVTRMVHSQSISLKNTFLKTLKILKTISEFQTIPLTHYMPLVSFYAPLKHHKTPFFYVFKGYSERPVALYYRNNFGRMGSVV